MASITDSNGRVVNDGDKVELVLRDGLVGWNAGQPIIGPRSVAGVVRSFEQVDRIYDEEGIAVGKTKNVFWEVVTGDAQYPAVGIVAGQFTIKE